MAANETDCYSIYRRIAIYIYIPGTCVGVVSVSTYALYVSGSFIIPEKNGGGGV